MVLTASVSRSVCSHEPFPKLRVASRLARGSPASELRDRGGTQLYSKGCIQISFGVQSDAAPTNDWSGFLSPTLETEICGQRLWARRTEHCLQNAGRQTAETITRRAGRGESRAISGTGKSRRFANL